MEHHELLSGINARYQARCRRINYVIRKVEMANTKPLLWCCKSRRINYVIRKVERELKRLIEKLQRDAAAELSKQNQ